MSISLVIQNAFHQIELIAFLISLGIHILGDHICSVFFTATIRELNFKGSCIQHGIGVGTPLHSPIKCTLAPDDLPSPDFITNYNSYLSANILVVGINITNVINVRHLGSKDLVIFIWIKFRRCKVCKAGVIFEVSFSYWRSILLFNLNIKIQASLLLNWRRNFFRGKGSHICAIHYLIICLHNLVSHGRANINSRAQIPSQLNLGNRKTGGCVMELDPFIFCNCGYVHMFTLHSDFRYVAFLSKDIKCNM
jgi:hypothetical protein